MAEEMATASACARRARSVARALARTFERFFGPTTRAPRLQRSSEPGSRANLASAHSGELTYDGPCANWRGWGRRDRAAHASSRAVEDARRDPGCPVSYTHL